MTPPPQARPRTPEELAQLRAQPDVVTAALARGVTDVLHFTTNLGVIGILASGAVKSSKRLPQEAYLKHVYRQNSIRKDLAWLDYVNLSVSRINDWMFDHSVRWHVQDGVSWVALSFTPHILGDPGVVFTTTNNIYTPSVLRAEGLKGFQHIFATEVLGRYQAVHTRAGKPDHWPTDRQAEVLYPGELSLRHLQRIDVQLEATLYNVEGILGGLSMEVPLALAPEVFT